MTNSLDALITKLKLLGINEYNIDGTNYTINIDSDLTYVSFVDCYTYSASTMSINVFKSLDSSEGLHYNKDYGITYLCDCNNSIISIFDNSTDIKCYNDETFMYFINTRGKDYWFDVIDLRDKNAKGSIIYAGRYNRIKCEYDNNGKVVLVKKWKVKK